MSLDLTFFFNSIPAEELLATRLKSQLTKYHPASKVIEVPDTDLKYQKRLGNVGNHLQRNYSVCLEQTSTEWIVKVDPDCYFLQEIKTLPPRYWGGTLTRYSYNKQEYKSASGGIWAIKTEYLRKVVESNLLLHPQFYEEELFEKYTTKVYGDFRFGYVMHSLGFKASWWEEVQNFKTDLTTLPKNLFEGTCVIHPVKNKLKGYL